MSGWIRRGGSIVPGRRATRISGTRIRGGRGSCKRKEGRRDGGMESACVFAYAWKSAQGKEGGRVTTRVRREGGLTF
jgi:hypothetical protein